MGASNNPYPYYKKADVFILTSQYEGKPIVVDEALSLKCPVIVTNYKSAREQVNENVGAVIDNQDDSISEQLFYLTNKALFNRWSKNLESYSPDNSISFNEIDKLIGIANE